MPSTRVVFGSAALSRSNCSIAISNRVIGSCLTPSNRNRGEGWGEGQRAREYRFPLIARTLPLSPEYREEGVRHIIRRFPGTRKESATWQNEVRWRSDWTK